MPLHSKRSLYKKLADPKYREAFISSRIAQLIATQIRVLRQKKEMSQKDLARELGTSQNAIYRLENPKYGRPSISTLKGIATYFEVGLIVRFAPLSEIVDWTLNMSKHSIEVPTFAEDAGFVERKAPTAALMGDYVALSGFQQGVQILPAIAARAYRGGALPLPSQEKPVWQALPTFNPPPESAPLQGRVPA